MNPYFLQISESPPANPCGGTIINTKYILTAMHCMVKDIYKEMEEMETFSASKTKVYIGGTLFNTIRNKKNGKKKNEKNKKKNKNYNQNKNKKNKKKNKKKNEKNNKKKNKKKNMKNIKEMKMRIKNSRKL